MSREGDWICCSCQHLNFKKRSSCQRCGYSRFGGGTEIPSTRLNYRTEVLAGDWYCNVINCGAHNFANRTNCYKCGELKTQYSGHGASSGLPGWRSGDWVCTSFGCGAHNYASKMECFKCGTPRDFSG